MTEPTNQSQQKTGLVLYCDGSVKPNPGKYGYGFHGYQFSYDLPKKGTGNSDYTLTQSGYYKNEGKDKPTAITPLAYYDGYGCTQNVASNNIAEMMAVKQGVEIARESKADHVLIKSDSEYIVKGINERTPNYIRNRWMREDGSMVVNHMEWKALLAEINEYTKTGGKFEIKWVKGHSDVFGNLIADKLASIGSANSRMGHEKVEVNRSAPEGYWKEQNDKSPLLNHRTMYFNTLVDTQNRGEYFIGNHGKEDDFLGKKDPEFAFACVRLKEPEIPLELVRAYQSSLTGEFNTIVILRIDALYSRNRTKDLEEYGIATLVQKETRKIDLHFVDDEPLTKGLKTPRLASRAMDELSNLRAILDRFQDAYVDPECVDKEASPGDPLEDYDVTDVTSFFYGNEEKTVKGETTVVSKLFDTLVVGTKTVSVTAKVSGEDREMKLVLGQDTLDRNALKRIEELHPKIYVLVWKESDQLSRYATAIKTDEGYGVWCGVYSNLVVLPKKDV